MIKRIYRRERFEEVKEERDISFRPGPLQYFIMQSIGRALPDNCRI